MATIPPQSGRLSRAYRYFGEILKLVAIPAIIVAGISAYFAYSNGSPSFVITYNGGNGIVDAENFDYRVDWQNVGGRVADDFTLIAITVNLSTGEHHTILLAEASNPMTSRTPESARTPVVIKQMQDMVVLCLAFKEPILWFTRNRSQQFYYKGQLIKENPQYSRWLNDVSRDERKRLIDLDLCG
jgi:hypothetical protein